MLEISFRTKSDPSVVHTERRKDARTRRLARAFKKLGAAAVARRVGRLAFEARRESALLDIKQVCPSGDYEAAAALIQEAWKRQVDLSRRRPWPAPSFESVARVVYRALAEGCELPECAERLNRTAKHYEYLRTAEAIGLR